MVLQIEAWQRGYRVGDRTRLAEPDHVHDRHLEDADNAIGLPNLVARLHVPSGNKLPERGDCSVQGFC
jgi:hypothetical protein